MPPAWYVVRLLEHSGRLIEGPASGNLGDIHTPCACIERLLR